MAELTCSRVWRQIGEKAELVQDEFGNAAVLVVHGSGCKIYPARCTGAAPLILDKKHCDLDVIALLNIMERGGEVPGKKQQGKPVASLGTIPAMSHCTFVVIGYSMMIRGDSFRSYRRVPTHMVSHLSNAMSVDRLVQSVGRATFQGKPMLEANGFDRVRVLIMHLDFLTVKAYMALMDLLRDLIMKEHRSLSFCFDPAQVQYPEALSVLAGERQRRNIGNPRELLTLDKALFESVEEPEAELERASTPAPGEAQAAGDVEMLDTSDTPECALARRKIAAAHSKYKRADPKAQKKAEAAEKRAKKAVKAALKSAEKAAEQDVKKQAAAQRAEASQKAAADRAAVKAAADDLAGAEAGLVKRVKRTRDGSQEDEAVAWAADVGGTLPAQLPAYSTSRTVMLRVDALGELRGEAAFRLTLPDGTVLVAPAGFRSSRLFKNCNAGGDVLCRYLQEVCALPGAAAPRFVVSPECGAFVCEADSPREAWDAAWEEIKKRRLPAAVGAQAAAGQPIAPAGATAAGVGGDVTPPPAGAGANAASVFSGGYRNKPSNMWFGLDSLHVQALIEALPMQQVVWAQPPPLYRLLRDRAAELRQQAEAAAEDDDNAPAAQAARMTQGEATEATGTAAVHATAAHHDGAASGDAAGGEPPHVD